MDGPEYIEFRCLIMSYKSVVCAALCFILCMMDLENSYMTASKLNCLVWLFSECWLMSALSCTHQITIQATAVLM